MIQIRDKEHQSLGVLELLQLCKDFPNDVELGRHLRKLTRENSKTLLIELDESDLEEWRKGTVWEKTKDTYDNDEYSKSHDEDEEDSRARDDWNNEGGMDYSCAFESDVEEN